MSNNLSITEKEKGVIIKHKSEQELSNSWFSGFIQLGFFILVPSYFLQNYFLMILCFLIIIASIVKIQVDNKIKNTLFITIAKESISIKHESNRNKKASKYLLYKKNVGRFFITRNSSMCYEIWVEKNNGQKKRLLGEEEGFFSNQQKEAETIMENMNDILQLRTYNPPRQAIQYIRTNIQEPPKAKLPAPKQRKINKEAEISKMTIKDLKVGVLFDYKNETWEVIAQTQYDWQRGNTDTLYQVQNSQNATILLLVCQDMAVYSTWLEERLPYHELAKNNLNKVHQGLPLEFEFRDKLFLKESLSSGHEFVGTNQGQTIKEWKYISENSTETLRILEHEDEDVFAFLGKKIEEFEFSNILLS